MMDPALIDKNLDAALRPLTEREQEVQEIILERFFRPLEVKHWEGREVEDYWRKIEQIGGPLRGSGGEVASGRQNVLT